MHILASVVIAMCLFFVAALGLLVSSAIVAGQHDFPDCDNGPLASNTVCDTSASVVDRAKALVAAIDITEKFDLLGDASPGVSRLGLPSYEWCRRLQYIAYVV